MVGAESRSLSLQYRLILEGLLDKLYNPLYFERWILGLFEARNANLVADSGGTTRKDSRRGMSALVQKADSHRRRMQTVKNRSALAILA